MKGRGVEIGPGGGVMDGSEKGLEEGVGDSAEDTLTKAGRWYEG